MSSTEKMNIKIRGERQEYQATKFKNQLIKWILWEKRLTKLTACFNSSVKEERHRCENQKWHGLSRESLEMLAGQGSNTTQNRSF